MNHNRRGNIVNDSGLFPIIHDYSRLLFNGYGAYSIRLFTKKCCQAFGIKQDLLDRFGFLFYEILDFGK